LERKLADAEVTEEEQNDLLKDLERRETEYMRLQRHKMGVDDFELLTIIGRGAFGEVLLPFFDWARIFFHCPFSSSVPNLLIIAIVLDITSQVLVMFYTLLDFLIPLLWDFVIMQVRLCREKVSGQVYAMKKLKKSEMLRRGQVDVLLWLDMSYVSAMHTCVLQGYSVLCGIIMACVGWAGGACEG
jgi:hypothetical protein